MSVDAPSSDHVPYGRIGECVLPRSHFACTHEDALGFALPDAFVTTCANEADISKNASNVLADVATLYGLPLKFRSKHTFRVSVSVDDALSHTNSFSPYSLSP
jgi:hypothetical protein